MPNSATASSTISEFRRCRSLTARGIQCRQRALLGDKFCIAHSRFRHPLCARDGQPAIPLLEDFDTIRAVASQIAQGLLVGTVDPSCGGKILYACQIAALGLPRPPREEPPKERPHLLQPVTEVILDEDGQPIGPDEPWQDPEFGKPRPVDWDKIVERNETHYCQSGQDWCAGTHMIHCCKDCRKRRLALLAEAESQRQHFASEPDPEVAFYDMLQHVRREAAELPNLKPGDPCPDPQPNPFPKKILNPADFTLDLDASAEAAPSDPANFALPPRPCHPRRSRRATTEDSSSRANGAPNVVPFGGGEDLCTLSTAASLDAGS